MSATFHIETTKGSARRGRLTTPHGEVQTPVFMPVGTAASVKGISQDILEELDVQILLGNTYHLYLRPGVDQVRKLGGLHRFHVVATRDSDGLWRIPGFQSERFAESIRGGSDVSFSSGWVFAFFFTGERDGSPDWPWRGHYYGVR